MDNLKPCPFCGEEAYTEATKTGGFLVGCTDCEVSTATYLTEEAAIKAWNTRADNYCGWWAHEKCHNPEHQERTCPNCGAKVVKDG